MTSKRFENCFGLITAAASGMGRAGALRLADEGAAVAVVDRDGQAAADVVAEIKSRGGTAIAIEADLRDLDKAAHIVRETVRVFGKIDFVWNHLGHPGPGRVEGMDRAVFELALDLNLRSVMATTEAAIPELRKSGGGSILFTSSSAGLIGSRYSPPYSAMKHAVVGFAKALSLQVACDNIRVNSVCPGSIETPMFSEFGSRPDQPSRTEEEIRKSTVANIPLERLGQPEEVAAAAAFLLSRDASFVTGVALPVDGGFVAK